MGSREEYEALTARVATDRFIEMEAVLHFIAAMRQESDNFNPDVVECRRSSPAGAQGIAQIMREFHPGVDPCDPEAALVYAATWLQHLHDVFGSWEKAYAAYNCGAGTVNQASRQYGDQWQRGLPDETRTYLRIIFKDGTMIDIPCTCPITQGFGENPNNGIYGPEGHTGIDFGCPTGTPITACRDGRVVFADWLYHSQFPGDQARGYGLAVVIQTQMETHLYGHNQSLLVQKGQDVRRGDTISLSGATGRVTGPHLHLERRINGKPVDPSPLLLPPAGLDQPVPMTAIIHSGDGLFLRTGPSRDSAPVRAEAYPDGTEVQVLNRDKWCRVTTPDGWGGYMAGWWLDFAPPAPPPPPAPPVPHPNMEPARLSAIRAWEKWRDAGAYLIESAGVSHEMQKAQGQAQVDEALRELKDLGM